MKQTERTARGRKVFLVLKDSRVQIFKTDHEKCSHGSFVVAYVLLQTLHSPSFTCCLPKHCPSSSRPHLSQPTASPPTTVPASRRLTRAHHSQLCPPTQRNAAATKGQMLTVRCAVCNFCLCVNRIGVVGGACDVRVMPVVGVGRGRPGTLGFRALFRFVGLKSCGFGGRMLRNLRHHSRKCFLP